jgi:hypothetical protein
MRAARIPKHVITLISVQVYSVLVGFGLVLVLIPVAVQTNVISGVFFSFLMGLAWFGYVVWMIHRISDLFQQRGYSATLFLLLYTGIYPVLAYISYTVTSRVSFITSAITWTCLHFILMYILLKITLRTRE